MVYANQAMGYAIQHIASLSQATINWEGCGRKGIRRKNGGLMEVDCWLVQIPDGVAPTRIVGVSLAP